MTIASQNAADWSARACSRRLWAGYQSASFPQRLLATLRPFICPLQPILTWVPPSGRVLDVGCGNGLVLFSLAAAARVSQGTGVEISGRAVEAARKIASANNLPLEFRLAESSEAWPDEAVDAVTMVDVLHHVPRPMRAGFLRAAAARVRPGGVFIYKDMNPRPWWRAAWNALHDLILARQLVELEEPNAVEQVLVGEGFEILAKEDYVAAVVYGHVLRVFRRTL